MSPAVLVAIGIVRPCHGFCAPGRNGYWACDACVVAWVSRDDKDLRLIVALGLEAPLTPPHPPYSRPRVIGQCGTEAHDHDGRDRCDPESEFHQPSLMTPEAQTAPQVPHDRQLNRRPGLLLARVRDPAFRIGGQIGQPELQESGFLDRSRIPGLATAVSEVRYDSSKRFASGARVRQRSHRRGARRRSGFSRRSGSS